MNQDLERYVIVRQRLYKLDGTDLEYQQIFKESKELESTLNEKLSQHQYISDVFIELEITPPYDLWLSNSKTWKEKVEKIPELEVKIAELVNYSKQLRELIGKSESKNKKLQKVIDDLLETKGSMDRIIEGLDYGSMKEEIEILKYIQSILSNYESPQQIFQKVDEK